MKSYFKFFSIALAGLMLGACSNEDIVDDNGGAQWNNEGTGYVNLSIKLPTTPTTRGVNDNFNDGDASEYAVKDATLILFSGTSESEATIAGAYSLNLNFTLDGTSTDAITTTANITQKINSISGSDNIYALVVLNNQGLLTVDNASLKVNGTALTGNLDALNTAVNKAIGTNYSWHGSDKGFLMSNAVLTTEVGGASTPAGTLANVQTLAPIDASKIYSTEAEASANPASIIYVERAEAKVTVNTTLTNNSGNVTDATNYAYTVEGWTLDRTNKSSKLVRTVDGYDAWAKLASSGVTTNPYRFVGSASVGKNITGTGAKDLYRVYWGDDYNYTATAADALVALANNAVPGTVNDLGTNGYCFENTTNLATMNESNCTRVIVKVKFNNGTDFYTIDGDVKTLYTAEDAQKEIAARIVNDLGFSTWLQANLKAGVTFESDKDLAVTFPSGDNLKAGDIKDGITVALTDAGAAKIKDDATGMPTLKDVALAHITELNYYAGGISYYPVYIAHFGDDLTPWDKGENDGEDEPTGPAAGNAYYGSDANYLGRWGVLRNNWYQINVTAIKSLGEPTVGTVTGETIDKKESYISVTVNTLPWAVRTQNVEL